MKKSFNILILAIVMCLSLSACGSSNNNSESTSSNSESTSSNSESTSSNSESTNVNAQQTQAEETTQPPFVIEGGGIIGGDEEFDFNQSTQVYIEDDVTLLKFKEGLDNLSMTYIEIPVTADLIGAQKAVRYQFDDETLVEVYKFDETSAAFEKVKKNKEVTIDGAGSAPVDEVSGNLALYIDGDIKNKNKVIDLFKSLKDE